MPDNDKSVFYNFTELTRSLKHELDERFKNIHSREEILTLVDDFVTVPADGKGESERDIITILIESDRYTGFVKAHGTKPLCDDRTDSQKVQKASEEYRKYAELLPKDDEVDGIFMNELHELYAHYRPSESYIDRIVRRRIGSISPEFINENDTTRLLILKQFLKAVEFPKNTAHFSRAFMAYIIEAMGCELKGGKSSRAATAEEIASLTDSVFDKLAEAPEKGKDAQKEFKEKWEWLIFADDVASGFFDNQHTIRRKIYIFSIIFQMTYNTGEDGDEFDELTDIEKNLFADYYSDNLIDSLKSDRATSRDREPSGYGINYKNFVEVIYLYFLHRSDLSPNEKLLRAEKMIKNCETKDPTVLKMQEKLHGKKHTQYYMSPLLSGVMRMDEAEFEEFIKENYILGQKGVNVIRVAEKNLSAADIYEGLYENLVSLVTEISESCRVGNDVLYPLLEKKYYEEIRCLGCARRKKENGEKLYKDCPYFAEDCANFFAEYTTESHKPQEWRRVIKEGIVKDNVFPLLKDLGTFELPDELKNDTDFCDIISKIEAKLKIRDKRNIIECIESTFMPNEDVASFVTRTKMVVLYYYNFILTYQAEGVLSKLDFNGFKAFFEEFCDSFELYIGDEAFYGLNTCLMEAGYQQVSSKNLFDMIMVFMAFKKYKF